MATSTDVTFGFAGVENIVYVALIRSDDSRYCHFHDSQYDNISYFVTSYPLLP